MGDLQISQTGQGTQRKKTRRREKHQEIEVIVNEGSTDKNESSSDRNVEQPYNEGIDSLRDFIYSWALEVAINEQQKNNGCLLSSFDRNSTRTRNNRYSKKKT